MRSCRLWFAGGAIRCLNARVLCGSTAARVGIGTPSGAADGPVEPAAAPALVDVVEPDGDVPVSVPDVFGLGFEGRAGEPGEFSCAADIELPDGEDDDNADEESALERVAK